MRWILLTFLLLSCGTNLSKDGLSSTVASTSAGVLGTVVAGPTLGAIAGTAAGVVADVATKAPQEKLDLAEIPIAERAQVLKAHFFWMTIEKLGMWTIAVGAGFFLLPMLIGYLMPNRRQRKLEKLAFDNPDLRCRDV